MHFTAAVVALSIIGACLTTGSAATSVQGLNMEEAKKAELAPCDVCLTVAYHLCGKVREVNGHQLEIDTHTIMANSQLQSPFGTPVPLAQRPFADRPLARFVHTQLIAACDGDVFGPKTAPADVLVDQCSTFVGKFNNEIMDFMTVVHRKGFTNCVEPSDMLCGKVVKQCALYDYSTLPLLNERAAPAFPHALGRIPDPNEVIHDMDEL